MIVQFVSPEIKVTLEVPAQLCPGFRTFNKVIFFVNLQPHRWNPDLFNAHDYCSFWCHLTNFESHLKSVRKFEIWPRKLKFFFPSAFLMEGMNSKTTKPITIPISRVFERYINHCCGCPECRVYPGHNRDLISSRDTGSSVLEAGS